MGLGVEERTPSFLGRIDLFLGSSSFFLSNTWKKMNLISLAAMGRRGEASCCRGKGEEKRKGGVERKRREFFNS